MSKYIIIGCFASILFSAIFYTYLKQDVILTKTAIRESLFDPESAIFSNITTRNDFVCGEVNAKNRWGGYTGKRRFISTIEKNTPRPMIEHEDNIAYFNEYWSIFCAKS